MAERTYYFASLDLLSTSALQSEAPEDTQTLHDTLCGVVAYELDAVIVDVVGSSTTSERLVGGGVL